ncbi:MAG: SDR family oxidoreductase [Pseudomonadota bacterium]
MEVIWITGAGSGLGQHLVGAALKRGHKVLASDLDMTSLEAAREAGFWGSRAVTTACDVRDENAWERALDEALVAFGSVDRLFNVAGVLKPGYLIDTSEADYRFHYDVNVLGALTGARLVARHMSQQAPKDGYRGHIINIASMAGLVPVPGLGLYSSTKFAIRALSITLSHELKDKQIAVTAVCPDAIDTPMLTLQEDYDEAAIAFSSKKPLTVADLERGLFGPVLTKRPVEYTIPRSRAVLSKVGNVFPALHLRLFDRFIQTGRRNQARVRSKSPRDA